jgi:hypothetical protein
MTKAKNPGKLAWLLLTALCSAGMLTFISQSGDPAAGSAGSLPQAPASLDPGNAASPDFGGIVPSALQKGAEIHASQNGETEGKPLRLNLR